MKIKFSQVSNLPKHNSANPIVPSEEQILIFLSVVATLLPYAKSLRIPLSSSDSFIVESPTQFELWTSHPYMKSVVYGDNNVARILFAGVSIRQEYVGLYFFPLFITPTLLEKVPERLHVVLRGDSVFHLREICAATKADIQFLLDIGIDYYREIGWI